MEVHRKPHQKGLTPTHPNTTNHHIIKPSAAKGTIVTFPAKQTLTNTPHTWFPECTYCQATQMGHERELLDKAPKLCRKATEHHFREFLIAEFDTLDHAKLSLLGQIEVLNAVHDKTGCDCLNPTISTITAATHPSFTNLQDQTNHTDSTNQTNPQDQTNCTDNTNQANPANASNATNGTNPTSTSQSVPQGHTPSPSRNATTPAQAVKNGFSTPRRQPNRSTILDRLKIGPTSPRSTP